MTCQNARLRPSPPRRRHGQMNHSYKTCLLLFPLHFIQPLHRQPNSAAIAQVSTPTLAPDLPMKALHQYNHRFRTRNNFCCAAHRAPPNCMSGIEVQSHVRPYLCLVFYLAPRGRQLVLGSLFHRFERHVPFVGAILDFFHSNRSYFLICWNRPASQLVIKPWRREYGD